MMLRMTGCALIAALLASGIWLLVVGDWLHLALFALALILLALLSWLFRRIGRSCSPFRGPVVMAGLASDHGSSARRHRKDSQRLLWFEEEVLRLVNEERAAAGVEKVGLHAGLLGEARQVAAVTANSWRLLPDRLGPRILRRGSFNSAAELVSVGPFDSPAQVVARWMRRRRIRELLLMPGFDVGAVGAAAEHQGVRRACVLQLASLSQ